MALRMCVQTGLNNERSPCEELWESGFGRTKYPTHVRLMMMMQRDDQFQNPLSLAPHGKDRS